MQKENEENKKLDNTEEKQLKGWKLFADNHPKIANVVKFFVIFVLASHILTYFSVFLDPDYGTTHWKAKAYMTAAGVVSVFYEKPLFKMSKRIDKPLSAQVSKVKDFLYRKGLENIPEGDGEGEIWWFQLYYSLFEKKVIKEINKYIVTTNPHFDTGGRRYEIGEIQEMLNWTDRLYEHIEPMATKKIKDPGLSKFRLNELALLVERYTNARSMVWPGINGRNKVFDLDKAEMARLQKVFDLYMDARDYAEKYDRPSFVNLLVKIKKGEKREAEARYYPAYYILWGQQIRKEPIDCNSRLVNEYGKAMPIVAYQAGLGFGYDHFVVYPGFVCKNNLNLEFARKKGREYFDDEYIMKRYKTNGKPLTNEQMIKDCNRRIENIRRKYYETQLKFN